MEPGFVGLPLSGAQRAVNQLGRDLATTGLIWCSPGQHRGSVRVRTSGNVDCRDLRSVGAGLHSGCTPGPDTGGDPDAGVATEYLSELTRAARKRHLSKRQMLASCPNHPTTHCGKLVTAAAVRSALTFVRI